MKSLLLPLALFISTGIGSAQEKKPPLPTVLLMGDSIRIGYAPLVEKKLSGIAHVIQFGMKNGGDTGNTLMNFNEWLGDANPTFIHFNNGLHDLKFDKKSKTHQVPVEQYEKNLRALVERLRKVTPHVMFATTTPILDDRHAMRKAPFDRFDADVKNYNAVAVRTMKELGVPIDDLNRIVVDGGVNEMLGKDGTHYTPAGKERLANAVADCIKRHLAVQKPVNLRSPASGPEAVKVYQKAEAERDAKVPEYFRNIRVPEFPIPASKAEWEKRRESVKKTVLETLGDFPPRPKQPNAALVSVEIRPTYTIERLRLPNGIDGTMSAMMMIPDGLKGPAPTILWLHSSSYYHTQLLTPNKNGGEEPLGEEYMKRGWVVFAPDAAWYGDRAGAGPTGALETTTNQQQSQLKFHLWFGRTLWGVFIHDDRVALDYMETRPEIDMKKVGATGISMGSTRSWWLAAVDDRVHAVVGVACLTRYENLIHHGQLRAHGVYYFVNGLLKHFDTEAVISLIAPRPVLFLTGELDAGSPADGIRVIEDKVGAVYGVLDAGDRFTSIRYPEVGHAYTPEMRRRMLAWFEKWLK